MIMGSTPMKGKSKIRQDSKRHQMEKNMPNKHETMTGIENIKRDRTGNELENKRW
jgi:hypothetical protein